MPRLRDVLPAFGILPAGPHNAITDVTGVRVGHASMTGGVLRTGITAVVPGTDDPYRDKVRAAAAVLNGYGKSIGLMQIEELGTLETPILLTSTLNVPRVADALLTYMMEGHSSIGVTDTINPIVLECFDGYLSDARARAVGEGEVRSALRAASDGPVEEGCVGAGTGMRCQGFKSGIGTASRVTESGYALGVLVVPNFGFPGDLLVAGIPVGRELLTVPDTLGAAVPGTVDRGTGEGRGSCVFVVATDAPLAATDLRRLAWRCFLGMARTGGISGWTSGDLAVAFTVSPNQTRIERDAMNLLFRATVETAEEAILNALFMAEPVGGRGGHRAPVLPLARVREILRRHGVPVA
ncbi:MAG TPA: P1 family peptidase [bacterium]|jgi:D-aminopeptidase|nr:P1 family peptidase [bacterium]